MNLVLRFLLVAFIFVACPAMAKVVITGKILHYDGTTIVYYHPTIEGIHTAYWLEVKPSPSGSFRIEFENKGIGTTTVGFQSHVYRFLHDENSKIEIVIDQKRMHAKHRTVNRELHYDSSRREALITLTGSYQDVNKFYNQNLRTSYSVTSTVEGNYLSRHIASSATPAEVRRRIDSLVTIEVDQINRIRILDLKDPSAQNKENDEIIRAFLTNEVHAFYGSIFMSAMFLKRKEHIYALHRDSTSSPNLYNSEWENLIEEFAVNARKNLVSASNSKDYNDMLESLDYTLQNYKQYYFPQNMGKTLDEFVVNAVIKYDTSIFRTAQEKKAHVLKMMQLYLNDQLFYSPALLNVVYDLDSKYTDSQNIEFFKPKIEKLKTYLNESEKQFDKAKIINSRHNTFASLLNKFEGKYLLIDVWATWCHPCIEQFKFKNKFQHLIDSGKIEVLYISLDKPEWSDRWKKSMRFNRLEGNHFRADEKFIIDMWGVLKGYEGAIPRYALVKKTGELYLATASQPSNGDKLIQEIEAMLSAEQQSSKH